MVSSFFDMINLSFLRDTLVRVYSKHLFIHKFLILVSLPCLNEENSNNSKGSRKRKKKRKQGESVIHTIFKILSHLHGPFADQLESRERCWRPPLISIAPFVVRLGECQGWGHCEVSRHSYLPRRMEEFPFFYNIHHFIKVF